MVTLAFQCVQLVASDFFHALPKEHIARTLDILGLFTQQVGRRRKAGKLKGVDAGHFVRAQGVGASPCCGSRACKATPPASSLLYRCLVRTASKSIPSPLPTAMAPPPLATVVLCPCPGADRHPQRFAHLGHHDVERDRPAGAQQGRCARAQPAARAR